jgi:hypothetical protein
MAFPQSNARTFLILVDEDDAFRLRSAPNLLQCLSKGVGSSFAAAHGIGRQTRPCSQIA